ncbi:MAG TPA: glucokinase [Alphaproteobacteria bacterium]|nr:glucokinase [Alphaproteobacteria bacterium]
MSAPCLIADVGGTNARFALCEPGRPPGPAVSLYTADFPGLAEAIDEAQRVLGARAGAAALAVAGPVAGDRVSLTNHDWTFSTRTIAARFGFAPLIVVNDFAALAWALPGLAGDALEPLGGGTPRAGAAKVALGPGTGLGVAALVPVPEPHRGPAGDGWAAVAGEGGHATLAAGDDFEAALIASLRRRLGHVSCEAVLSGPGLVRLHTAVVEVAGAAEAVADPEAPSGPEDVSRLAAEEPGGPAGQAVAVFCRLLGGYAGDLALTFGARGGVYLAGGILPALGELFDHDGFRRRFEDKGRFAGYMATVPAFVIRAPQPALDGLSALLAREMP